MKISTPCISLCVLDEVAGLCAGCGRTRHEIGGWSRLSEKDRRALMQRLPARLAALRAKTARETDRANAPGQG